MRQWLHLPPPPLPIIFFSIWLSINLFRYFSYLALRVSWIDPRTSIDNLLNKNLFKLTDENNQFLQGLISSNRALGISALANSLAHQLSQPITGIVLQTENVKRDLIEQGNQKKLVSSLNVISGQLEKMFELVNNLRRLFTNKDSNYLPFKIKATCEEILEIIQPTLQSKMILFSKHYEADPIIFGNPIHVQQVLINLINNAIESIESFNSQRREINLRIFKDQTHAVIAVQDTGGGINVEMAPRMFELYQSTKQNGLGIGLWLSKTVIDKHKGSITGVTNAQGGALFEIRIPLSIESKEVSH